MTIQKIRRLGPIQVDRILDGRQPFDPEWLVVEEHTFSRGWFAVTAVLAMIVRMSKVDNFMTLQMLNWDCGVALLQDKGDPTRILNILKTQFDLTDEQLQEAQNEQVKHAKGGKGQRLMSEEEAEAKRKAQSQQRRQAKMPEQRQQARFRPGKQKFKAGERDAPGTGAGASEERLAFDPNQWKKSSNNVCGCPQCVGGE